MDLDTIGAALRRKLGPLPVWIWAVIGGAILYFLRTKGYFGGLGAAQSGETLQPRQASANTPQPVTQLQPGESVYDPNSGSLTTAPGGSTGLPTADPGVGVGVGPMNDYGQAIQDLSEAILNGHTDSEKPNASTPRQHKPSALERAKAAVPTGKIGPKNKARLVKAGYSARQISYHLRRHTELGKPRAKSAKPAHKQTPAKSAKDKNAASKPGVHAPTASHRTTRTRSAATVTHPTGGRTTGRTGKSTASRAGATPTVRSRVTQAASNSKARQRPTVPTLTRAAPVQHPVSAHHGAATKKQAAAHAAAPASRAPSSPAPRAATRAPAPSKKTKPPKKRK